MPASDALEGIQACVFDAYGTLFDVHSAIGKHQHRLGGRADQISLLWRTKQLEYTWIRSLMGLHADFWKVTQDALDFALDRHGINDPELRADLMEAYLKLDCYPEVPEVLSMLKDGGFRLAILSNGTPAMLEAAVKNSNIEQFIEKNFSVEEVGIFKPDFRVYQIAVDGLGIRPEQIVFLSSNAWDAHGAAAFGFKVTWVNRFGQSKERLPGKPHFTIANLLELPNLLG
ncbi:2-haloacid dehalogenase [Desulfacinum infernum DSM 9756]|uniref:2-haloacid dehalogenase n=1 Tax=Desulfacinum infernum DSM 9756 TaxID=1121391 RepID=A0A1M4TD22_9BACT|nr:haloacid dehalogenase type II [Desulfacinum infernum]SHE42167.1 2-haloacid dehalogenase [Desulfacinum infernum DSM 9756]